MTKTEANGGFSFTNITPGLYRICLDRTGNSKKGLSLEVNAANARFSD